MKLPIDQVVDFFYDNIAPVKLNFNYNFTVIDSFENPEGKIPSTFGDAAIIDCNYANNMLISFYEREKMNFLTSNPLYAGIFRTIDVSLQT